MVTVVNESGERSFLFDSVFSEGRQEDPREENDEGIESRRLLMKSIYIPFVGPVGCILRPAAALQSYTQSYPQ